MPLYPWGDEKASLARIPGDKLFRFRVYFGIVKKQDPFLN